MKNISCKEMGGVCDEMISAESMEELEEKGKAHVHGADDDAHKEMVEKMKNSTEEEIAEWRKGAQATWDNTADA